MHSYLLSLAWTQVKEIRTGSNSLFSINNQQDQLANHYSTKFKDQHKTIDIHYTFT